MRLVGLILFSKNREVENLPGTIVEEGRETNLDSTIQDEVRELRAVQASINVTMRDHQQKKIKLHGVILVD